jgi:DNA-binding protein H-NS
MTTLEKLENRIAQLQKQAEALRQKESVQVIASIRKLMSEHNLTAADIDGAKSTVGRKRGRPAGSTRAASAVGRPKANAVAAKGKLPAKYRDPATGATWSGWARPPAWIKDVADRTPYLIDGAAAASGERGIKASAKSKAAAPKGKRGSAAVKRTVAKKPASRAAK